MKRLFSSRIAPFLALPVLLGGCGLGGPDTCLDMPGTTGSLGACFTAVAPDSLSVAWPSLAGGKHAGRILVGPEPASTDGSSMPGARDLTVSSDDRRAKIEHLAPGTDVFVWVEIDGVYSELHARLPEPERAEGLRVTGVGSYGPSTLMVTVRDGGAHGQGPKKAQERGHALQAARWQVQRADGRDLPVLTAHRWSVPLGQPAYSDKGSDETVVDVEHRIFLELAEPVGAADLLQVKSDDGTVDLQVPWSDRYLETPILQVNQVGYNPRASRRWAYVSGWMGDGGPIDLGALPTQAEVLRESLDPMAERAPVLQGQAVTPRKDQGNFAGSAVAEIDLSKLPPAEGVRYRVRLPGVGVSVPTAVSEEAALRAHYTIWRGLYHNRWCGDLDAAHTDWSRAPDHCKASFVTGTSAGFFDKDTPTDDTRPVIGGHHDAGNYQIRPMHVVATEALLRAVEMDASRFPDGQLVIPESGNGLPDTLDEALWSVAAWEQLQDPDGGVRSGVVTTQEPINFTFANQDPLKYYTYDPVPWHTAHVAGAFAEAAFLVQPYDKARAAKLQDEAERAYAWAQANGANDQALLYGAGELFRLTGERRFDDAFRASWSAISHGRNPALSIQPIGTVSPGTLTTQHPFLTNFVVAYARAPGADAAIVQQIIEGLNLYADNYAARALGSPFGHRHARPPEDYPDWGQDVGTGRQLDAIYQRLQVGPVDDKRARDYFDAASVAADYMLGCNPASMSYVTGLGSRSPQQPLHMDSLAFQRTRKLPPVPGLPVFGPVTALPNVYWIGPVSGSFYPAFGTLPGSLRYADSRDSSTTSEFSVWEMQAPAAELSALLVAPNLVPPATWRPGGAEHRSTLASIQ